MQGRRVVVTGSGRGIGAAVAAAFAARGAHVVVTARTEEQVAEAAEAIVAEGGVAYAVPCDITSDSEVGHLVRRSHALLGGPVDTLINNAGVYRSARFADHTLGDWQTLMEVNVVATVRVTNAFLEDLLAAERSRLLFMASIAGKKGSFGQAAYNASKHAQVGIARCMALEYGHTNLRVNAICPGFTKTDLIDLDALAATHGKDPATLWREIEAASTIGRTVRVEEIAALALYLASDAADAINGQAISIDGGITYA